MSAADIAALNSQGIVAVHVTGSDIPETVETREEEPAHVVCVYLGAPLTAKPPGDRPIPPVLNLDPVRKEALFSYVGTGQIFVCHSAQQAEAVLKGDNEGVPVVTPVTFRWHGSAGIWIVAQSGTVGAAVGGVITERRGS